jgi:hypothetical protein
VRVFRASPSKKSNAIATSVNMATTNNNTTTKARTTWRVSFMSPTFDGVALY